MSVPVVVALGLSVVAATLTGGLVRLAAMLVGAALAASLLVPPGHHLAFRMPGLGSLAGMDGAAGRPPIQARPSPDAIRSSPGAPDAPEPGGSDASGTGGSVSRSVARDDGSDTDRFWSREKRINPDATTGDGHVLAGPTGLSASASASQSLDLPILPAERNCERLAASLGAGHNQGSRMAQLHHCMREEQSGYDLLKLIWDELSDQSKRKCLVYASKDSYQYTAMQGCASGWLALERAERERRTKPAPFRY